MEHPLPDSEAPVTFAQLQAEMRRNAKGHIVCEGCGGKVRYGWMYRYGAVVLATCAKPACQPRDPHWKHAINFR